MYTKGFQQVLQYLRGSTLNQWSLDILRLNERIKGGLIQEKTSRRTNSY